MNALATGGTAQHLLPQAITTETRTESFHLVYLQIPGWDWSATQIQDAYERVAAALDWWNQIDTRRRFQIADLRVVPLDPHPANLPLDQANSVINGIHTGIGGAAIYLARSATPWYPKARYGLGGFADGNHLTVFYGDGFTTVYIAHELGHLLGAPDFCAPDSLDLMCYGMNYTLSAKTRAILKLGDVQPVQLPLYVPPPGPLTPVIQAAPPASETAMPQVWRLHESQQVE